MKIRTVNSHSFMSRTGSHSTKGSRRGFVNVNTGTNPADLLTEGQKRQNLRNQIDAMLRLRKELIQQHGERHPSVKALGVKICANERELRNFRKGPKGFAQWFVQVAEDELSDEVFSMLKAKAAVLAGDA